MNQRKLGHSPLSVSTLCFGGNVFGWTVDQATSFKLLDAYSRLIGQGKVRCIGASNIGAARLAQAMAQPGVTSPIASATSLTQLHDLIESTRVVLTPDQITLLNRASASI